MTLEFTPAGFDAFQNNITEVSTIRIGTASSTGTANQALQVGTASIPLGAYISGNLGIGTTNPQAKTHIIGINTTALKVEGNTGLNGNININNTLPLTVSYGSSFVVLGQEGEPREVAFSNDGRTMYVLGNGGNDITWYTLSTPWSVTTASFVSQFSVASQTTVPIGLTFKPDGTKFYIVGLTGTVGAGATSVSEYSCTTPWDLTTAGFTTAFSVISQDTAPQDIEFSNDGTKFYVLGSNGDAIYQYSCTTPWSVASNVSYASSFSVVSQETTPEGFAFSNDGTKLLLTGSSGDDINYYTLSTPWDITTTSFVGIITAVGAGTLGETAPSGLCWKPDGTKLYLSGYTNDTIYEFNITSNAQLEVTGKTYLYGDVEIHESLDVYGEQSNYENAYFYNKVGIGTTNPTSSKLEVWGSGSPTASSPLDNAIRIFTTSSTGSGSQLILNSTRITSGKSWALVSVGSTTGGSNIPAPGSFIINDNSLDIPRLVINPSGNIGIGTTNPLNPLTVNADSNALSLGVNGRSLDNLSQVNFYANNGTSLYGRFQSSSSTFLVGGTTDLIFGTGGSLTEKVRITSAGSVGIGTTNPTFTLEVNGRVRVGEGTTEAFRTVSTGSDFGAGINTFFSGIILGGDNEHFIGYGKTSSFAGTIEDTTVVKGRNLELYSLDDTRIRFGSTNNLIVYGGTNSNERLRVTSGGNVGIGITNPVRSLHVVGSGTSTSHLFVSGVSTSIDTRIQSVAEKSTLVSGNTVNLVYSSGSGNIAICTNPSGSITLNVTGIPTDSSFDNRAISFAVIVQQGTTAYACTTVTLNGVTFGANAPVGVQTQISYSFGIVATGSTSGYDVFNFTGINTIGSASTTLNYKILSNVNGDYRRY